MLYAIFIGILALTAIFVASRLRAKRFYFIRHGRTLLNESHVKQGAEGGLSPAGKEEAERLGLFLGQFRIEAIYTSPFERARETAEIIHARFRVPLTTMPLLQERRNPSEVVGKSTTDPEVERITGLIDLRFHKDGFRYSDEENFIDLRERARTCLRYLEKRSEERIAVVTHHAFLKMLLAYMLYRNNLHATDFLKLSFFNQSDNAGVTVCEYHPARRWFGASGGWEILSYNDQLGA